MDLDPRDNQFVLIRRELTGQDDAVRNRVNGYLSLIIRMNMWQVVSFVISKEHPNQKPVEH